MSLVGFFSIFLVSFWARWCSELHANIKKKKKKKNPDSEDDRMIIIAP